MTTSDPLPPSAPIREPLVIRDSVEWRDLELTGDAADALIRIEEGGRLHLRGGSVSRTGSWGSLVHVRGGELVLEEVRLEGAQEHYLLPEPRPARAGEDLHGAVLVTGGGRATLDRVQASGNAPALRVSVGEARARGCTFVGMKTAAVDVQADESGATLNDCRVEGTLYMASGRVSLRGGRLAGATLHFGARLELEECEVTAGLVAVDSTLAVCGGKGSAEGTVVFARGKSTVRLEQFVVERAGGRGVELQGAATARLEGGRICRTGNDGVAAFDASTLELEGTGFEEIGGAKVRLAGVSDGPADAEAFEFASPGGPGGDAAALIRARLDALDRSARPLFVERLATRADPGLREWTKSLVTTGSAALDLKERGPLVQVTGEVVGLEPTADGAWVLTADGLHRLRGGELTSWKLPAAGYLMAVDARGAVVATGRGLFDSASEALWPLPAGSAVSTIGLSPASVTVDGVESTGHPTDRVDWRVRIDRETGRASAPEITGQGGSWGSSCRKAVVTASGEARIYGDTLMWGERSFHLPGGIVTLAADGEGLLVGTGSGAVYRID
jgi:hypothetical protein